MSYVVKRLYTVVFLTLPEGTDPDDATPEITVSFTKQVSADSTAEVLTAIEEYLAGQDPVVYDLYRITSIKEITEELIAYS